MSIKVVINGARGRMGSLALKAIEADPSLILVGTSDIGDNLRESLIRTKPDIAVDFTVASVGYEMALTIIECGVRPVIGTSGFVSEQVANLSQLCEDRNLGGIIAPNFSISAVLMMKYVQDAVRYLPDAEIIELHHSGKEDAPSGTALRTAELIHDARSEAHSANRCKELLAGARGATHQEVPIHSIRLNGLVAHQEVIFGGIGQSLTIRSDTISRDAFMPGVVLACKKVMELDRLVLGLEHIL